MIIMSEKQQPRRKKHGRLFKPLETRMFEYEVDAHFLAVKLQRSVDYVKDRLLGHKPWNMWDIVVVCRELDIDVSEIPRYFLPSDPLESKIKAFESRRA